MCLLKMVFFYFFISDSTAFSSSHPHAFQINFNSLYTALCEQQKSDQATLLLYMLLHQNSNVRTYVLARTDIENLVSIALLTLYSSRGPGSLGVTSCRCPCYAMGAIGSRSLIHQFWLSYSFLLCHLRSMMLNTSLQYNIPLLKLPGCLWFPFSQCHCLIQVKPADLWARWKETGSRYHSILYFIFLFWHVQAKKLRKLRAYRDNS